MSDNIARQFSEFIATTIRSLPAGEQQFILQQLGAGAFGTTAAKPDHSGPFVQGDSWAACSGAKPSAGTVINGYEILRVFEPGGFSFGAKAKAPDGKIVLLRKYKRPGGGSPWLDGFIAHHHEIRRRVIADPAAQDLCLGSLENFVMSKEGGEVPLKAFYQVFEWLEGGKDLRTVLDELKLSPNAYDWNQRLIIAREILFAVNALHNVGIVHSDLKPEHFILGHWASTSGKYNWRLCGFDFSLVEGQQAPWHAHGEGYVGTPGYMSPEHLAGMVPTKASDVFTLGLILGELLAGAHPAAPAMDTYDKQIENNQLKSVNVHLAGANGNEQHLLALNRGINAALDLDPMKRPSVAELLAVVVQLAGLDPRGVEVTASAIEQLIPKQ